MGAFPALSPSETSASVLESSLDPATVIPNKLLAHILEPQFPLLHNGK